MNNNKQIVQASKKLTKAQLLQFISSLDRSAALMQSKDIKKKKKKKRSNIRNGNSLSTSMIGVQKAPVAIGMTTTMQGPKQMQREGGGVRIVHSEMIQSLTVVSSETFPVALKRFRMNPGSQKTFRWLSNVASSFEMYKFHKLRFRYVPRCPSDQSGFIISAIDYDAADNAPQSENLLSTYMGAVESNIWQGQQLNADPRAMNRLYKNHVVMDDGRFDTSAQDEKTIDVGQCFIYAETTAASISAGKIWVDYDVELSIPQPLSSFPVDAQGGQEFTKTTGILVNSLTPFTTNSIQTSFGNEQTFVKSLLASEFPSAKLLEFTEPFTGIVSTSVNGSVLTDIGTPTVYKKGSGVAVPATVISTSTINGAQTQGKGIWSIVADAGDKLGWSQISGTSFTGLIADLGSQGLLANNIPPF
jgi:hypothetical protein